MKKILYIVVALSTLLFASCSDFMDVQSESKFGEEYVYSSMTELDRVLNSVYVSVLDGNLYGERMIVNYALNSDVEFSKYETMLSNANGNDLKCFDGTASSTDVENTWRVAYQGVERANLVIYGIENSPLFNESNADYEALLHKLGEAKTLRAMIMHDMVVHFGDVPFPKIPTFHSQNLSPDVEDRHAILEYLIEDLKEAAPQMKYARDMVEDGGIERASREFAYGLIAKIALTRGGYSLRPDKANPTATGTMERAADYRDYYQVAMHYADSVIKSGTHTLSNKSFAKVFVDECNYIVDNGGDAMFFGRARSARRRFGPQGKAEGSGASAEATLWGKSAGNMKLNSFYYFSFDKSDVRRDVSVGLWEYNADGTPVFYNDYGFYANKWSKFWATESNSQGKASDGSNTGFNYPYMRYAEVLLMYAEAVNEVENGVGGAHGQDAKDALREVRRRAFPQELHATMVDDYVNAASGSKEDFFEALVNERKWEFGGENVRWKDLVRWNRYAKTVYDVFMDYYTMGMFKVGEYWDNYEYYEKNFPSQLYTLAVANPSTNPDKLNEYYLKTYQNTSLQVLDIRGMDGGLTLSPGNTWSSVVPFAWGTAGEMYPSNACCYSLRGYIRGGREQNYMLMNRNNLPPVRYIFPMPRTVITLSQGNEGYKNYYGY